MQQMYASLITKGPFTLMFITCTLEMRWIHKLVNALWICIACVHISSNLVSVFALDIKGHVHSKLPVFIPAHVLGIVYATLFFAVVLFSALSVQCCWTATCGYLHVADSRDVKAAILVQV